MHQQWWPSHIQSLEQVLFHDKGQDTFIFRHRADGVYIVLGDPDPVAVKTLLMVADIVKYTNQRMKQIDYDQVRGYFYA